MKSEQIVDAVCRSLFNLRTKSELASSYYPLIAVSYQSLVLETVKEALGSITIDRIAELEAKVFVYEEIIKKSNFAPMVKEKESEN